MPLYCLALPVSNLPPYAMFEDEVWVDEAKAVLSRHKKKKKTTAPAAVAVEDREVRELLREMFRIHTDVYSLMLAFVRQAGKTRHPPRSLPRIALATFKRWLEEGEGERRKEKEEPPRK